MAYLSKHRAWAAILTGGLVSGFLDIVYACARSGLNGIPPGRVLQSVAGGLMGRAAFDGGAATAVFGLALHFLMTIAMAALFVVAAMRSPLLRGWLVSAGLAYGAAIYLVMNRVVLPLSAFPGPQPTEMNLPGLLVHIFFVGLPIALAAKYLAPGQAWAAAGAFRGGGPNHSNQGRIL